MFTIDFTKPWLYKDIIYFNQGNLSTNNTLRCKLVTGGSDDFTGGSIACTFTTKDSVEISGFGKLVDAKNGVIDIVFPSNSLVVGNNKLEILVNRADGGVAQSPPVMYDIWQGLTTGNGVEAETNYPILIELINSTNEASNKANLALNKANSMITDINEATDNAYRSANEADIATSNANSKITELDDAKTEMITKVDASIDTMKTDVNKAKEDMKLTTDAKVKEIDTAITNMNSSVEDVKSDMQATTDAKMQQVDRALAAGTVDLELKQAREDASGVTYDTLKQMLDANLGVEGKTLKDFVVDMNGMKESQDLAYDTDVGFKVCQNTQNGVVKDLKVYGKSLVNRGYTSIYNASGTSDVIITDEFVEIVNPMAYRFVRFNTNFEFEVNKKYTIVIDVVENTNPNTIVVIETMNGSNVNSNEYYDLKKGVNPILFTVKKENSKSFRIACTVKNPNATLKFSKKIMILEGDHTQNPPSGYIEGITSVGNGNEIEVLSRKEDGNLFDDEIEFGGFKTDTGELISSNTQVRSKNFIPIEPNNYYYMDAPSGYNLNPAKVILFYDNNKNFISYVNEKGLSPLKAKYCKFRTRKDDSTVITNDELKNIWVMFNKGVNAKPYTKHKQDKKPILFKDVDGQWKPVTELRGIDIYKCDTIEEHSDGKHYLHVRTEKKVFDGINNLFNNTMNETETNKRVGFVDVNVSNKKINENSITLICDKESVNTFLNRANIGFYTVCNDLTSQNGIWWTTNKFTSTNKNDLLTEANNSLKTNPITIIYPLAQEKVYEVNPLDLESFDNETLWLILSGVISPPASFKITSSLPNFVKNVDTRVKRMENDFYKYTVTQNRMQLGTTYSSDRTTFRVDTATFSSVKAKQDLDYDLFRLLKHNILVGPQNYDKAEMENMMDFYVSVGKIDYNMWDELYMLIEEQHNPPVEEETPVI